MNPTITRRATAASIASSAGSSNVGAVKSRNRRRRWCDVEAGLGILIGGRVGGQAGALGDDPRSSRTSSSGRSSRSSGRPIRARRISPRSTSTWYSPSSKNGALNSAAPSGPMTSEPPQNVIDSSTPTRFTNTTRLVVSWA